MSFLYTLNCPVWNLNCFAALFWIFHVVFNPSKSNQRLWLHIFNKQLLVDTEASFYCGLTMIQDQKHFPKVPKVCAKLGRSHSRRKKGINSILRWIKGRKRLQVLINNIKELEILFLHNFCRLTRNSAGRDQLLEDDSHVILVIISLRQISQIDWV